MYIHRIILRDVNNFEHLDLTFHDDWRNEPLKSILLTGPNGSGKTTLLRVIAALWENFGQWVSKYATELLYPETKSLDNFLSGVGLAAIEIHDMLPEPLCIYAANHDYVSQIAHLVSPDIKMLVGFGEWATSSGQIEGFKEFGQHRERLLRIGGEKVTIPNLIYLDTEERNLLFQRKDKALDYERLYEWLITYEALHTYGDITQLMSNLKIRDPEWFYRTVKQINGFMGQHKQVTDFDDALKLRVEINHESGKFHYIDDLSSGEQQCLMMMYIVSRWLMPGGIVLIDEPDLHLHASLQRHLIHTIEKEVKSKGGQMIVTSHSRLIWEEYRNPAQSIELREVLAI
jgi:predicted ATP-binding protein involved in virulence